MQKSMYTIIRHIRILLVTVLLAATAAGCSQKDEPGGSGERVKLRFSIDLRSLVPTGGARSRAINMPVNTQKGTLGENFIDLSDITFVIFDADRNVLCQMYPTVTPEDGTEYTRYTVECSMDDPYFTEPKNLNVDFYIMVLANYSQYSPQNMSFVKGQSMQYIFNTQRPTFGIPEGSPWWYPHIETLDGSTGAYPTAPQYMPMAGLQHFSVPSADFLSKERIDLPDDIYMLRSMAKIEVVDRIDARGSGAATVQPDATRRSSVEKAELMGFYSRGTILPEYSQWNVGTAPETQYVTAPYVPVSIAYANPTAFSLDEPEGWRFRRDLGEDELATAARADGCKVFSVYIPEYGVPATNQQLLADTHPAPPVKAWIQVTVQNPSATGTDDISSVLYELKLTSYNDGASTGTDTPILRNNIYRYEIVAVKSNLVNVEWTVCPMAQVPDINIPDFN